MSKKTMLFLSILVASLVLDQATKIWVVHNIAYRTGEIVIIPDLFSLVHAQNPGAAFSFMHNNAYKTPVFMGFTVLAVGMITYLVRKLPQDARFLTSVFALIMSGAIGNAIDRVHKGTVTDFLRVYTDNPSLKPWLIEHLGMYEWPSFNVADMALVIGVSTYLLYSLLHDSDELDAPPEA